MTDKTTHKPGCAALGGYGHGVGPCSCSEAGSEGLELADRLISNAEIDECEGCNPVVVGLERSAATELRRQHAEIQQLKAQLSARQAAPVMVVTEAMHEAAVKVLHRANGVEGLPQRMLNAMLSALPHPHGRDAHERSRQ